MNDKVCLAAARGACSLDCMCQIAACTMRVFNWDFSDDWRFILCEYVVNICWLLHL